MPVPACGNGRARAERPRARRSPLEGGVYPRAGRSPLEGGVYPQAGRSSLEGGVYPRARRSLLEGTFEWAALVGRGGHRGVGRAPCALKQDALSFGFLQVLSGISHLFKGTPRAVPDTLHLVLCLREGMQIFVKTLHRQGAQTSLGWLPLRQVSVSQDKSLPCTASSAPTIAWAPMHGSGEAIDACGEANLHVTRERQLAAIQPTCSGRGLNASLTSRATVTSPSTSTLPHARPNPRHSSTLYDAHGPRLRLARGKLGKYSGRLRQDQTTRGEGQASRSEQSGLATRRLPQQDIATELQCSPTDDDVRRDVPTVRHCISFFLPFVPLSL
jgi:hypothetical protein